MSRLIFEIKGTSTKKNIFKKNRNYVAVYDDHFQIELNGDSDVISLKDIFNIYIKEPIIPDLPCRTTMIEFAEEGEDNWYEVEDDVFAGFASKVENLLKNEWSSIRQGKDTLPEKVKWFNATCAILRASAEQDLELFGGYFPNADAYEEVKEILYESWSLNNKHEFIDMLKSLYEGRSEKLYELRVQNMDQDVIISRIKQACGDKGIWAWDLCRITLLCGYGYLCKYISYEDALDWSSKAGKKMQSIYTDWDDMMKSYLLGYCFWSGEDITDPKNEANERAVIYKHLRKLSNGPFTVNWHANLD